MTTGPYPLAMPLAAWGYVRLRMLRCTILSLECAHTMRRLLLTFLLLFMPLQSIWAAASPYCGHEAAPQASHFGHHVHEHQADASAEPSKAEVTPDHKALATSGAADMDCHACHGAGSGMTLSASAQAIVVSIARPAAATASALVHAPLSRPERPNWSVLA